MKTVIVGAGSAGGALAARLSEHADQQVVLVEAGPDYPDPAKLPADLSDAGEMSTDVHDWKLASYYFEPTDIREPQPYPRGRVVGGSSSVNAAIAQRGCVEDFTAWALAGNHEWSWDKVLPYFERLESDLQFGDQPGHGSDGPVPITRHPRSAWPDAAIAFEQACLERGYPLLEDTNEPGGTGVGPAARNLVGDVRASSLVTYLAEARGRPNLDLVADATCRRVLFEGQRAVGVEIERDGRIEQILADRIVLSAGTIHTPQILTLSGVGPRETLDALGIPPVVVNDAVGRNLQDHPLAPVITLIPHTDLNGIRAELKYTTDGGRSLGLVDDIMMYPTVMELGPLNQSADIDTAGRKVFSIIPVLAKPRSVGWLRVVSTDPHVQPEMHLNYLSDRSDVERIMEAVRLAYSMTQEGPVSEVITQVIAPDAETVDDDARLEEWLRGIVSTAYHATSTCRMGPDGDEGAVVDQRLAVRGTENLWIADASVMYAVPTGLTNLASFMIGERMASWLVEPEASPGRDGVGVVEVSS